MLTGRLQDVFHRTRSATYFHFTMKKLSIFAFVAVVAGLASCQTKCPAYTQKAANRQASAVTASAAQAQPQRL
jgi:hypothetical protein